MEKVATETINPITKKPYSIYDHIILKQIANNAEVLVPKGGETIQESLKSLEGIETKRLLKALLDISDLNCEMEFASRMVSNIALHGQDIARANDDRDGRVGNIFFICEYLGGEYRVRVILANVNAKDKENNFNDAPCINGVNGTFSFDVKKECYLFITPNSLKTSK